MFIQLDVPKFRPRKRSKRISTAPVFPKLVHKFQPITNSWYSIDPPRPGSDLSTIPSGCQHKPNSPISAVPYYAGEMAIREVNAQREIKRKRKCIAITTNKGAYQYVGDYDLEQIKTLGK